MTEQFLRNILEEGKRRDQVALVIWSSKDYYNQYSHELSVDLPFYQNSLLQASKGRSSTLYYPAPNENSTTKPGLFIFSIEKLLDSPVDLKQAVKMLRKKGPVFLMPSNELIPINN